MDKWKKKKDWGYVLRKAYQQMEDVDREKFLKGLKSKVSDPNGYDFLEGWTWGWIVNLITQARQETLEELLKDAKDHLKTSENEELVCFWINVIEWISQTIKQRKEGK